MYIKKLAKFGKGKPLKFYERTGFRKPSPGVNPSVKEASTHPSGYPNVYIRRGPKKPKSKRFVMYKKPKHVDTTAEYFEKALGKKGAKEELFHRAKLALEKKKVKRNVKESVVYIGIGRLIK